MARILLIDDDEGIRNVIRTLLSRVGHAVVEARDGKHGLDLLPIVRPDLLITDLVMPVKEGLEVIMEVRKKAPGLKVIAMSGGGRQTAADGLQMARHLGAGRVLTKPFSAESLIEAVEGILAGTPEKTEPPSGP
jgi:CheY-like chemotaxis protein